MSQDRFGKLGRLRDILIDSRISFGHKRVSAFGRLNNSRTSSCAAFLQRARPEWLPIFVLWFPLVWFTKPPRVILFVTVTEAFESRCGFLILFERNGQLRRNRQFFRPFRLGFAWLLDALIIQPFGFFDVTDRK